MPDKKLRIVADGRARAHDANIDRIRAEVAAKYADELEKASFWELMFLRRRIKREVRKRLEEVAPGKGLY